MAITEWSMIFSLKNSLQSGMDFHFDKNDLILRRRDVDIRHIQLVQKGVRKDYLIRIINKKVREKNLHHTSSCKDETLLNGLEKLCDEINIREQLNHPNIVSLYAVRETDFTVILCISHFA